MEKENINTMACFLNGYIKKRNLIELGYNSINTFDFSPNEFEKPETYRTSAYIYDTYVGLKGGLYEIGLNTRKNSDKIEIITSTANIPLNMARNNFCFNYKAEKDYYSRIVMIDINCNLALEHIKLCGFDDFLKFMNEKINEFFNKNIDYQGKSNIQEMLYKFEEKTIQMYNFLNNNQ